MVYFRINNYYTLSDEFLQENNILDFRHLFNEITKKCSMPYDDLILRNDRKALKQRKV